MKDILVLLIAVVVVIAVEAFTMDEHYQEWTNYKKEYNKTYDGEEDIKRFEAYKINKKKIDEQNALYESGQSTWKAGINQFTDKLPGEGHGCAKPPSK